jgi:Ca-activated chloride channel family protein
MDNNRTAITICALVIIVGMASYLIGQANPPTGANARSISIHEGSSSKSSNEYISDEGPVDVQVQLGSDDISVKDGTAYMLITLKGDKIEFTQEKDRMPLNLSIVIDRSGSMNGDKLDYVKRALYEITPLLDYDDRISLVIYDDSIETVYCANHFEKNEFLDAVDDVNSGGSTYLEGGLREGIRNVKQSCSSDYFRRGRISVEYEDSTNPDYSDYMNRVILLSDGLANVGVSDSNQLARIVEELAGDNITVSTIGVGANYDERLMTSVARAGNGNYYFLEDPRDAERIFTEEFESVLNTVARDITVEFNINNNFEVVRGIGYELEDSRHYNPHDIYSEREVSYLFEIQAKDLSKLALSDLDLADLKVKFHNVITDKDETISVPVKVNIVDADINVLSDDDVYYDYMQSYKAEVLWDVYEDLDKVDNVAARDRSDKLIDELTRANGRLQGEFNEDLEILKEKREYLEELEYSDVNASEDGRSFQKANQRDSYGEIYEK